MELKKYNLAEIVNDLKEVIQYDINFISTDGVILYSSNPKRIGTYHQIGKTVCIKGETIKVFDNDDSKGVKCGINSPIVVNDNIIGCIGMTGAPKELEQYQTITKKLTERYIQAQLYVQDAAKSKKLNIKIISEIKKRESLILHHSDLMAKGMFQGKSMAALLVAGLSDSNIQSFLRENQTLVLCTDLDSKLVIFADHYQLKKVTSFFEDTYGSKVQIIIGPVIKKYNQLWYSLDQALSVLETTAKQRIDVNLPSIDVLIANEYRHNKNYYTDVFLSKIYSCLNEKKTEQIFKVFITYYESNKSITATADILHVSESTVKYQLKKLVEISEIENNYEGKVLLYIALKIHSIDNLNKLALI